MRPKWGLALFAWKSGHKLAYQFEDGVLRKFRARYGHLFEPVDLGEEERAMTVEMLLESLGDRLPGEPSSAVSVGAAIASADVLDAQVNLFREQYSNGFRDEEFQHEYREREDRRVKRHAGAAIAHAQELLSEDEVNALADTPEVIWDRAVEVMEQTDLVTPAKLKPFAKLDTDTRAALGRALAERLHGDRSERARFRALSRAVKQATGKRISWSVATVVPALVHPNEEIVVRPSVVRSFIQTYELELSLPKTARYPAYRRLKQLYREMRTRMEHHGLLPEDGLDVYRFLHLTLRRKAIGRLEELLEERRASDESTQELAA